MNSSIPNLSVLVPLRFPQVVPYVRQYQGVLEPYQKYYYEHPRAFLSRFLSVLQKYMEFKKEFWYVLQLGNNHFLSLRSVYHDLYFRFTMEKLKIEKVGGEEMYKTVFHQKTYDCPIDFLNVVFSLLTHYPPVLVYNYFENQPNMRYTPRSFLQRTKTIPMSHEQLVRRIQSKKQIQKQNQKDLEGFMDKSKGFFTIERAETSYEPILENLRGEDLQNWYESMHFRPRRPRRKNTRREYYEPASIFLSQ